MDILEILPLVIPIVVIQVGLQIIALVNLVKRKKVRFDNKYIWGLIIILGGMLGSIVYFTTRGDEE